MESERREMRVTVCEGYQILLRAEAELRLPTGYDRLTEFYRRLGEACMGWAKEVHGERLRRELTAYEDVRERGRFRTQRYRLRIGVVWEDGRYASVVSESELTGQWKTPDRSYHRISHVWDLEEQSVLPFSQILSRFGLRLTRSMLPFRPDGIYPEGEEMVFFRNVTDALPFLEKRLPRSAGESRWEGPLPPGASLREERPTE